MGNRTERDAPMIDRDATQQPEVSLCSGCPLCHHPPSTVGLEGECGGCALCDRSEVELEGNAATAQTPQRRVGA